MMPDSLWGIWVTWTEAGAGCTNWFRHRPDGERVLLEFDSELAAQRFINDLSNLDQGDVRTSPATLHPRRLA